MIVRIVGAASFLLGLSLVIGFPCTLDYQPEKFTRAGILIGIVLLTIGLYLLKT